MNAPVALSMPFISIKITAAFGEVAVTMEKITA
jgi:hypothetical protein